MPALQTPDLLWEAPGLTERGVGDTDVARGDS